MIKVIIHQVKAAIVLTPVLGTVLALYPTVTLANHHGDSCLSDFKHIPREVIESKTHVPFSKIRNTLSQNNIPNNFTYATCQIQVNVPNCQYLQWCFPYADNKDTFMCASSSPKSMLLCRQQAQRCYGNSAGDCQNPVTKIYPAPGIPPACFGIADWNKAELRRNFECYKELLNGG